MTFFNSRILLVALLSFISALPIPLLGSNLSLWLAEEGITKATIAGFALLHLPYSLRILWNPLIEKIPCPLFSRWGQKRSWAIASLFLCQTSLLTAGYVGPFHPVFPVSIFFASLFSGWIYLISIHYEIHTLDPSEYPQGSTWVTMGYRLGLLFSGASTLLLAHHFNWNIAYCLVPLSMLMGILILLLQPEPTVFTSATSSLPTKKSRWITYSQDGLFIPIRNLFQQQGWVSVFFFILTYKLGQDLFDRMIGPFYVDMGFSKIDIAHTAKLFGMGAIFLGSFIASRLLKKIPILRCLFLFGLLHTAAHGSYFVLSLTKHNLFFLYCNILMEQISSGMMITGLITFLWNQCRNPNGATQYTFLWSVLSFKHDLVAALGGVCVSLLGWDGFFLLGIFLSFPSLLALIFLMQQEKKQSNPAIRHLAKS